MTDFLKAIKDYKEERNYEEIVYMQNGGVIFNGLVIELNMEISGLDFVLVINGYSLVCVFFSLYYVQLLFFKFIKVIVFIIFVFLNEDLVQKI